MVKAVFLTFLHTLTFMWNTNHLPHSKPDKSGTAHCARTVLCAPSTNWSFTRMFHRHLSKHMYKSHNMKRNPSATNNSRNSPLLSALELLDSFGSPWKWWLQPSLQEVGYLAQQLQMQLLHWKQLLQMQVWPRAQRSLEQTTFISSFFCLTEWESQQQTNEQETGAVLKSIQVHSTVPAGTQMHGKP